MVGSYKRLLKWYLLPPCLTLSNIRYVSRGKWNNPGKGVAPSLTPWNSSYWKGSLLVALNYGCQLNFFYLYKKKSMAIVVEGDPKVLFSIATTQRCMDECYPYSLNCSTLPLICNLYYWVLSKEDNFLSLWYDSTSDCTQAIGEYCTH